MDDDRRAIAEGRPPAAPPTPAARSSPSSASWASRRPALDRQCRIAGLPSASARSQVPAQVGQLVRDGAEDAVVVEAGLADRHDPLVGGPGHDPLPARPSSTFAASCGWTPTAASSQGHGSTRSRARSLDATFQPGHEDPLDAGEAGRPDDGSTSSANRSALRWQWESMRRIESDGSGRGGGGRSRDGRCIGAAGPPPTPVSRRSAPGRSRRPGAGTGGSGGRDATRTRPPGAPGELVEDRRAAVAVGAVGVGVAQLGEDPRRRCRA